MTTVALALIAAAASAAVAVWATHRWVSARVGTMARRALVTADGTSAANRSSATLDSVERHIGNQSAAITELGGRLAVVQASLDELSLGVVVVNPALETILRNRAADNLVGVRHADALIVRSLNDHMRTALAGQTRRDVVELFGPPRRTVVVRSGPVGSVGDNGTVTAAIVTVEDVSERSRLEAMRTDFVANISHELRTPVGALALLAETLQGERDAATIDRLASKLEVEAMRVSRTIDDLLELSRIETEGARRTRVPVDAVVGDAVDRVRAAAEQRAITIVRRGGVTGLAVAGDPQQLVSAVTNLIDNAVKYSDAESSVTVTAEGGDGEVAFVVCDQGMGIPAADLDRIFERFYRVDRARSRVTGGTGLGLSIVRHVANNHGGTVSVSSREGAGSTFTLRVPAWRSTDAVVMIERDSQPTTGATIS